MITGESANARILVVDDNPSNRYLLSHSLRGAGHEVLEASTGGECLRLAAKEQLDLILLDVKLPDSSGVEVCRQLKSSPGTAVIPVIQISAVFTQGADRATGLDGGADAYLLAPVEPRELLAQVRALLRVRRSEAALRKSEALLRNIGDNLPDTAVFEYMQAPDGTIRYLYCSAGIERLTGVSPENVLRDARTLHRQIPPDHFRRFLEQQERCARDLTDLEMDLPMHRRDGQVRWMRLRARPQRLPDGHLVWDGVQTDITERRLADEALRQAEERFSRAFRASPDALAISAVADGSIREMNDRFVQLFGLSREEALRHGLRTLDVLEPADREKTAGILRRDGRVRDLELRRPAGSHQGQTILLTIEPIQVGTEPCLLTLIQDITGQKESEEKLRQLNQRLEYHIRNTPLAVIEFDADLRVSAWNEGAQRIFGWESPEVLGRPMWDIPWIHEADRADVEKTAAALVSGNDRRSISPNRNRRKDGKVVWCEWHNSSLTDPGGKMQSIQSLVQDVTERVLAEAKLRASEERFRSIYENAATGIAITDLQGRFLQCNPAYSEILGYTEEELRGIAFPDLVHPEDRDRNLAENARLLAGDFPSYRIENRYRRKGGQEVWVQKFISILRDDKGAPANFLALVTDITERRKAEAALRESEEQFRAMFTVSSVGKAQADAATGRLLRVNEAFCRITGYTEEELLRRTIRDITHPEDREADFARFSAMATGKASGYESEKRYVRPDGSVVWVHISANLIRDAAGRPLRTSAVIEDITARKQAEAALMESEKRLRLAKAAADIGIHDFNPVTGELHWDDRLRELWGLGPDDPVTYDVFISGVHPDDRSLVDAAVREALDPRGNGRCYVEYRLLRGGRTCWIAATGDATFVEGRAIRFVGTAQDITGRKEFQAELERLVEERTAKLHDVVGELEHLSYSITHDMRAPLRAMRGFAEVIKDMSSGRLEPELQGFLERIISAAERMDNLITDALNYSKAVRQEIPLAPVDLDRLLGGMLDTYPEFLNHRTSIRVQGRLPRVLGNDAALTQCLSNLIGNALKFVEPGKRPDVLVRSELIQDSQPMVNAPAIQHPQNSWVRLWVEDKGIGIPETMRPRIFNMFTRGTGNYEGTGIGLALVRKVVQRMGGRIGVESEPGKGSRFYVDLRPVDFGRA